MNIALLVGLRTLDGTLIEEPPMALLTWDLDCPWCLVLLGELDRAGFAAVAISLDGAGRRSVVRARTPRWTCRRGWLAL